jgi:hypothetical protein
MRSETRRAIAPSRSWPGVERAIEVWAQLTEAPTRWLDRLIYAKDRYIMAARNLVETVRDHLFGLGLDLTDPLLRITPGCWSSYDEERNHLVVGFGPEDTIAEVIHELGHKWLRDRPEILEDPVAREAFDLGPDRVYPGWFYDGWLPRLYLRCSRWRERRQFVSTYAMAHPEEDFCETLVAWVRPSRLELEELMQIGPLAFKFRAMTALVQRYGGRGVDPISCR